MHTIPPCSPELWKQRPIVLRKYLRTLEARVAALEATVPSCWDTFTRTHTTPRGHRRVLHRQRCRNVHAMCPGDASMADYRCPPHHSQPPPAKLVACCVGPPSRRSVTVKVLKSPCA